MWKDYKTLKYPEGFGDGLIFSIASGFTIDFFGDRCGIKRRKFWLFKEPDYLYKIRLRNYAIENHEGQKR